MKIRIVVAAAALLVAVSVARAARVVERVVAVVNDEIILESELDQYAAPQYRGPDPDTADGKKQWDETKRKTLDSLIDSKLIQAQAKELKLSATTEEVDRAIAQVKEQNKLDDATFKTALEQQGFT
ncbi:MAG: SurA N-terminal domain-containing protein, partial [Polyangia bacterium]